MGLVTKLMKFIVFGVNIILWAAGIVLLVIGAVAVGNPSSIIKILANIPGVYVVTNLINIQPLFQGVAIFMIVLGSILFLFGGIGCHGACRMHKRMIMNYWILLIIGVLVEIALIIYAAVYPPTTDVYIEQQLYGSLISEFQPVSISSGDVSYSTNLTAGSWEVLQSQSHCCGAYGPEDYATFNWTADSPAYSGYFLPPTCCVTSLPTGENVTNTNQFLNLTLCELNVTGYYYTNGCYLSVEHMVHEFDLIALITSVVLINVELIALFFTIRTWHRLVREEGGY